MSIYGYFTQPGQETPVYDPGLKVNCPVCGRRLKRPMITISLMLVGDDRSYFYRTHRDCYNNLSPEKQTDLDSVIVDAVAFAKENVN